jgi:hypothetical protein
LRRRLAFFALVASLVPGVAAAADAGFAQLDPQDQARARAMLVRKSDLLPTSFTARGEGRSGVSPASLACPGIASASVEPTGDAGSPSFAYGPIFVSSHSTVYATPADANAVWGDLSSNAGLKCLTSNMRTAFERNSGTVVSFRRTSFPRVGERRLSFRLVARVATASSYVDLVIVKHSRATSLVVAGGAGTAVTRSAVLRYTKAVAGRMKSVMRGA